MINSLDFVIEVDFELFALFQETVLVVFIESRVTVLVVFIESGVAIVPNLCRRLKPGGNALWVTIIRGRQRSRESLKTVTNETRLKL